MARLVVVATRVLSIDACLIQAYRGTPTEAARLLTIIGPTVPALWLLGPLDKISMKLGEVRHHGAVWNG